MPGVHIRPLQRHDEFQACERIQENVWGAAGVGSEALAVTQRYGGAVIGAFVGGRVAGFLYAFIGRRRGRLIHWSHLMAVAPEFRDLGLGFQMKLEHRRRALAQGIRSICWTYDPLQSRNAALNIARLGAAAEEYVADCYGRFPSLIEKGLPSDRFVVNWRIATRAVARRLGGGPPERPSLDLPRANETRLNAGGFLENSRITLGLRDPRLLVEIPANTDVMRSQALRLAKRWRAETRRIFQRYFAAGFRVKDFVPPSRAEGRCFYVLRSRRRLG
ncbi:MAG TPA: hypothetical protein VGW33_11185 [Terriglobia bacterium]|nr:hypothetical protein [Terriglobia bacterium]